MPDREWQILPQYDPKLKEQFPEYSGVFLQLLYNRGLVSESQVNEFLNPDYDQDLHDPYLMTDMDKAVKIIEEAIKKEEPIMVYGDYDADGVTGTVLLQETLVALGAKRVQTYIPSRQREGNGLNEEALKKFSLDGIKLVVTVDTGIRNVKEAEAAKKMGLKLVITDHHQIPPELPEAQAVVNPKRNGDRYPFKELSGVGVAFKLAVALGQGKLAAGFEKWFLDLVAVGTIADISPIIGENRTLVKYGLLVLNKTKRLGLRRLISAAGLKLGELDTYNIGFQIAPRLNAAGRLIHAKEAYELLVTRDLVTANQLAEKLNKINQERQEATTRVSAEIDTHLGAIEEQKIVVAWNKKWPIGLCGLVASDLTERYRRPFFIIEEEEDESRGSARSSIDFSIVEAMTHCKDLFSTFGGHRAAGGFTLPTKNLAKLRECLEKYAADRISPESMQKILKVDMELSADQIDWPVVNEIEKFRPWGEANYKPRFLTRNFEVLDCQTVGSDNKHLKLRLAHSENKDTNTNKVYPVIGFGFGECSTDFTPKKKIDLVYELEANEWNGSKELQLKLVDYRQAEEN